MVVHDKEWFERYMRMIRGEFASAQVYAMDCSPEIAEAIMELDFSLMHVKKDLPDSLKAGTIDHEFYDKNMLAAAEIGLRASELPRIFRMCKCQRK